MEYKNSFETYKKKNNDSGIHNGNNSKDNLNNKSDDKEKKSVDDKISDLFSNPDVVTSALKDPRKTLEDTVSKNTGKDNIDEESFKISQQAVEYILPKNMASGTRQAVSAGLGYLLYTTIKDYMKK